MRLLITGLKSNFYTHKKGDGMNKYGAKRTYSELCGRTFASKAECRRGEELALLEKVGEISSLKYQIPFVLCVKPKVTITIDFSYIEDGAQIYEDAKGMMMRDFRVKLAWLKEKHGIEVRLIR